MSSETKLMRDKIWRETHREHIKNVKKRYYELHKEEIREKDRYYNAINMEKKSLKNRLYREKNASEISEKMKLYREENKEKIKKAKREYYLSHRDEILEKKAKYRVENSEKVRLSGKSCQELHREEYNAHRRERNREMRETVINHYGGCCSICGTTEKLLLHHRFFDGDEHRKRVGKDIEVFIDIINRGFPENEGYQILCRPCHMSLHDTSRHILEPQFGRVAIDESTVQGFEVEE
jgi:hypothetical protein